MLTELDLDDETPDKRGRANLLRCTKFYAEHAAAEHILNIESDALVIRKGCVEDFFKYGWVGAPFIWDKEMKLRDRRTPGNSGFNLRRRSVLLRLMDALKSDRLVDAKRETCGEED